MCCPPKVLFFFIAKGERFLCPLSQKEQKEYVSIRNTQNHHVHKDSPRYTKMCRGSPAPGLDSAWTAFLQCQSQTTPLTAPTPLSLQEMEQSEVLAFLVPLPHVKEWSEPLQRDTKNTHVARMGLRPLFTCLFSPSFPHVPFLGGNDMGWPRRDRESLSTIRYARRVLRQT